MSKETYLENLTAEVKRQGYGEYYLAKCIRYASRLLDNGLPVIFDTKHLSLLIGIAPADLTRMVFSEDRFYTHMSIPKKRGGQRELDIPSMELKYVQRWILDNVLYRIRISDCAVGFCEGKSIIDNAKRHLNQHSVITVDIKDFFPSTTFEKVYRIFSYYGYTNEVSFILAKLCTFRGRLPQGSPASPYISNIVCLKMDARLNALAKTYEAVYSRYADDLTFSSKKDAKSIVKAVEQIVNDEGYDINAEKTRIAYPHQRQEVTGLIVNGAKIRIAKSYKRKLYQELYYCSKFGVSNHMSKVGCNKAFYKEHVYGKIYFVNMVEPEEAKKLFAIADEVQWDY